MKGKKYCIVLENVVLDAFYSEPVYDEYPDVASYSRDTHVLVFSNTPMILDEYGCITFVDVHSQPYGSSTHEGSLVITSNVQDLENKNLVFITEDQFNTYMEWRKKERELLLKLREGDLALEDIEAVERELLEEIRTSAGLTQNKSNDLSEEMWKLCEAEMSVLSSCVQQGLQLKEVQRAMSGFIAPRKAGITYAA